MATIEMRAYPAQPNDDGSFAVILALGRDTSPLPVRRIDVTRLALFQYELERFVTDARATGKPCAVSARVVSGRSPVGFKDHPAVRRFVGVNV